MNGRAGTDMSRRIASRWLEMDPQDYDTLGDDVTEAWILDSQHEAYVWKEDDSNTYFWSAGFSEGYEFSLKGAENAAMRAIREDADFEFDPAGGRII